MTTPQVIAAGKIKADGTILKATPGIDVKPAIHPGNIFAGDDIGYTVLLPHRLVKDKNYIIQLTADNYGEDGPDYVITSIACRNQTVNSFEVIIWADRIQTIATSPDSYTLVPVRTDWHFTLYDVL